MSRTATISGEVFQVAKRANGETALHLLPGTQLSGYAEDRLSGQRTLIGETAADSDGKYVLHVLHKSDEFDKEALARWQFVIVADYQGHEWTQREFGPVYAMPPTATGQNIIYDVPEDGPAIFDPGNTFGQPWHGLIEQLAADCGLTLADVQMDFDIEQPFEKLTPQQQRAIAQAVFQKRITDTNDLDWFVAQLVEVLTPGTTQAELAKDQAAEKAIKEVLGCCDDCTVKPPIDLPPWDISLPKLPSATSLAFQFSGLQLFVSGMTFNGRMYIP